ncbi:hypothetical protein ACN469_32975 [Corallococcus terminator]
MPTPLSNDSIVRHVLYLDGAGRETPYLSTSESQSAASHFAGRDGKIWKTLVKHIKSKNVHHISMSDLLAMLRGSGKGAAKWPSALETMTARKYVEQWSEHLLDFRDHKKTPKEQLEQLVHELFEVP